MDLKKIKALLEKYYNGDATIEEEEILKNYFQGNEISDEFIADKDIFMYNSFESNIQSSLPDLSNEIWENIKNQESIINRKRSRSLNYMMLRVAAGFAILFSSYFLLKNHIFGEVQTIQYTDTYKNPEQAYLETKKTLLYVSQLLNRGTNHLEPIHKIEDGASKLKSLSSFNDGLKELDPIKKYNIADKYIKQ
jgi:hypothetical protein